MIQRIKDLIKKLIFMFIKVPIVYQRNSYSQAGEDVVIDFLLQGIGKKKLNYLEIGTSAPMSCNNTYKFYLQGGKGVLVEADETIISNIKQARPRDKVINVGVGVANEKNADFYIFNSQGLNTFDKKEAEYRNEHGSYKIKKVVKVRLESINKIIDQNFDTYPLFLSIDIEGLDLAVLKTLDFSKYPIPIICAETCTYSENHIKSKDKKIEAFMLSSGYFVYADTYINTIFVNENWFLHVKKNI